MDHHAAGTLIDVEPITHTYALIIDQDCDLLSDFVRRTEGKLDHQNILQHVLLCDVFKEQEIRLRLPGGDLLRRVKQNQDERFHCLPAGSIGDEGCEDCAPGDTNDLPPLYLDFKRVLTLRTSDLYRAIELRKAKRLALIPPIYSHDLIHRFYSFRGRIGLLV